MRETAGAPRKDDAHADADGESTAPSRGVRCGMPRRERMMPGNGGMGAQVEELLAGVAKAIRDTEEDLRAQGRLASSAGASLPPLFTAALQL